MRFISACESDWLRVIEDLDFPPDDVIAAYDVSKPSRDFVGVISLAEARSIVSLKHQRIVDDSGLNGKGAVDEQKWAKLYDGKLQLGRYVGQISVGDVCIEIKPKIERSRVGERAVVPFAPFVLFNTKKDSADSVPTLGYGAGGAINESFFDYFAASFIRQLSREVSNGLRSGYEEIDDEVPALRGRVLYSRVPAVAMLRPHLLPCRFDDFSQDTVHNRILKQALSILTRRIFSPSLRQLGEGLISQLGHISDTCYEWEEIREVEVDRLQARYSELIKHAKLTIRSHFAFVGNSAGLGSSASRGFVMIWDVERLYEVHAYKVLAYNIAKGSRLKLFAKFGEYSLANDKNGNGVFNLEPDLVLCEESGKVVLILDTKWKNFEEKGVVAADAYQMMAYAQCLRKGGAVDSAPVVLLYPSKDYASQAENTKNTYVFTNLNSKLMVRFLPLCLPSEDSGLIDYYSTDLNKVLGPEVFKILKGPSAKRAKRQLA